MNLCDTLIIPPPTKKLCDHVVVNVQIESESCRKRRILYSILPDSFHDRFALSYSHPYENNVRPENF